MAVSFAGAKKKNWFNTNYLIVRRIKNDDFDFVVVCVINLKEIIF